MTTYITACLQRLKSDSTAFEALREPLIFTMPNEMLAQSTSDGKISIIG